MFAGEWMSVLFMHYEIEPRLLQPHVPFTLDVRGGQAYVSLVAFTQQKLRFTFGGPLTVWVGGVMGNHDFLNVRTYIREQDEPGIHFIAEWVPNWLATWVAPPLYGLPYRLGCLDYDATGGRVTSGEGTLQFRMTRSAAAPTPTQPGSRDAFLLERYMAVTQRGHVRRQFHVQHEPWPQMPVEVKIVDDQLLRSAFTWWDQAHFVGANYSPGVPVRIGRPVRL
jgi:uncharacterized protein YqjF (DUF2071 family)